jgi:uncharacterized protein YoxC
MFGKFFKCLFSNKTPLEIELNKQREINARLSSNGKNLAKEYQGLKGQSSALNRKYQRLEDENVRLYKDNENDRIELSEMKAKSSKDYEYMVELENELLLTKKPELLNDVVRKNLRIEKVKKWLKDDPSLLSFTDKKATSSTDKLVDDILNDL